MFGPISRNPRPTEDLRELIDATYSGREDLCAAAEELTDEQLVAVCCALGRDLANRAAYRELIWTARPPGPPGCDEMAARLAEEILRFFRRQGELRTSAVARGGRSHPRPDRYEIAIAATGDPEARSLLRAQSEHMRFAECVLPFFKPSMAADSERETGRAREAGTTGSRQS